MMELHEALLEISAIRRQMARSEAISRLSRRARRLLGTVGVCRRRRAIGIHP